MQKTKLGRPPKYVEHEGATIKGLSGPKPPLKNNLKSGVYKDGRFYSTHNDPRTGMREYFGTDLDYAVRKFKSWKRRLAKKNGRKT